MEFAFDSSKPPGQRIVPDSVSVGGKPLDLKRSYRLATKAYLAEGKDGFDCLEVRAVVVVPSTMQVLHVTLDITTAGWLLQWTFIMTSAFLLYNLYNHRM